MAQATDKELGILHKQLAQAFSASLDDKDTAQALLEEHGDDLPAEVYEFLKRCSRPNPALMSAIVKFLKDNSVTCAVEDSQELTALEQRLKNKKRASVNNIIPFDEIE